VRIWPALLLAPSLALACQLALYSLVTPLCGRQQDWQLHAIAAGSLLLTALMTVVAGAEWHSLRPAAAPTPDSDGGDRATSRRFLAAVATAVGALSALAIAAMWLAVPVLSPCLQ
jgi:hypothetical protein